MTPSCTGFSPPSSPSVPVCLQQPACLPDLPVPCTTPTPHHKVIDGTMVKIYAW